MFDMKKVFLVLSDYIKQKLKLLILYFLYQYSQEKIKIPKMHKVSILTYYHPAIDRLLILELIYLFRFVY